MNSDYSLNDIQFPEDLRKVPVEGLPGICDELRQFIIKELSENPGHLAASLGTVELTVALHYTLNTPYDRIVWDVGHQAYGHKILTGRREQFHTLRKKGGISGFPTPEESPYDTCTTGHASNSLSVALGLDLGAQFRNEDRLTVAVIGDGAMTGGLAYEALNNISGSDNNVLVILNDNKYSIDRSVGGFSKSLTRITTSARYNSLRWRIYLKLKKLGWMDDARKSRVLRMGNWFHTFFSNHGPSIFDGLDLRYFGPVDGHDVRNLVRVLRTIKNMKGPRVLHICTVKGHGFAPAEERPTKFHAPGKFDINTGKTPTTVNDDTQPIRFQDVFGQTLSELAELNDRIVAITPAMPTGCGLHAMMEKFPGRVFDVGIAEGHAVTFSAGLARAGMIPFCNIYSTFSQRAYDNIINDVAISKLPFVLCLDRAGLVGEDGVTHQGAFDIAALRCIPNLTIAAPINEIALRNIMFTAQKLADRPFVIRYPRGKGYVTDWKQEMHEVAIGKGNCLEQGEKVAVLSIGPIGLFAQQVIQELRSEGNGISPALYDFQFIKPLDTDLLHEVAAKFDRILTIENGCREGGFGSAVLESLNDAGLHPTVHRLGIPDHFIEHASVAEQREMCGMDEASIRGAILELYNNI